MKTFREIREHYHFIQVDEERLMSLSTLMEEYVSKCIRHLHEKIYEMKDKSLVEKLEAHQNLSQYHKSWFLALFSGNYDSNYYHRLFKIGKVHLKEGLEPHYMNVSMNIKRAFFMEVLSERIEDRELRTEIKESLIATLQHEKIETMYYLTAATLVIGIVFWLVTKAEEKIRK